LVLYRFPLLDGTGNDPDLLHLAITSVVNLLKMEIPTLVCCGAEISRSPAIVAAALSLKQREDLEECLKQVAEFRPVDLSPGFWSEVTDALRKCSQTTGAGRDSD